MLPCAKRVNDEQQDGNRDARIGDVKRRPGIGVPDVQIKEQKIDHVSVKEAIGEISQNACQKKRERYIPGSVRPAGPHEQNCHNNQCDDGNNYEESVVPLERSERSAGIGDANETKEVGNNDASVVRVNRSKNPLLRQLV